MVTNSDCVSLVLEKEIPRDVYVMALVVFCAGTAEIKYGYNARREAPLDSRRAVPSFCF